MVYVEIEPGGGVYLYDGDEELVCWIIDEWIEDPETVVTAMANALVLLYTDLPELRRILGKD